MVCIRCKLVVKNIVSKLGLTLICVELGEIEIQEFIDKYQLELIRGELLQFGLELMDDKKSVLIQKIKNVVAFSGYISEPILEEEYLKNDLSKLNIFASHGTSDQVIPVEWARKSKPFLEKLGVNITYKEYPIGHGISPQNFFDFKNWLLQY